MKVPLLGRGECTIDSKRRITLPARLRELLALVEETHQVMVTVGHHKSLMVVPASSWEEVAPDVFRQAVQGDPEALRLRSTMARYGTLCRIDGSGRITLTEEQMGIAGLARNAIVFGNFSRIEIWSPERFDQENPPIEDSTDHDARVARYVEGMPPAGGDG